MTEIELILNAFDKTTTEGKAAALATVVHVEGSSYRRPGARMLITEDGKFTGSISGGCLEGDALRKALFAIHSSKSMLVTYDTSDEDDAKFGMGLGCNGIIQVLIEPIPGPNGFRVIDLLRKIYEERKTAALVTLFSLKDKKGPQPGSCLVLTEDGDLRGDIPFLQKEIVVSEAQRVIKEQQSSFKSYLVDHQEIIVFTEIILPVVSLVIIGGGNDVIPLVKMADVLGWQTLVADGRPMYANKERFPVASCQVLHSKPEDVLHQVKTDRRTVFVLMSHNYNYDLAILRTLLEREVAYIGVLGPKTKLNKMIRELNDEGIQLSQQQLGSIYGPVGLHIGAETAEEIALSILAEIKSVLASGTADSLRNREDAIHKRSELRIEKTGNKTE